MKWAQRSEVHNLFLSTGPLPGPSRCNSLAPERVLRAEYTHAPPILRDRGPQVRLYSSAHAEVRQGRIPAPPPPSPHRSPLRRYGRGQRKRRPDGPRKCEDRVGRRPVVRTAGGVGGARQWTLYCTRQSLPRWALCRWVGETTTMLPPGPSSWWGFGMTPGCVAVCSWRHLLASRHLPLLFP